MKTNNQPAPKPKEKPPVIAPWEFNSEIDIYDSKGNYSHTEIKPDPFQLK